MQKIIWIHKNIYFDIKIDKDIFNNLDFKYGYFILHYIVL